MQRKIEKNGFEGIVEYGKRSDCTYGSLKPCPVPAMVYNQPRIEIESNSKSKSILGSSTKPESIPKPRFEIDTSNSIPTL